MNVRLSGYVKLDVIHDFTPAGNRFEFKTASIPITGTAAAGRGARTTLHARESRLRVAGKTPTDFGDAHVVIEGDFYGASNTIRARW